MKRELKLNFGELRLVQKRVTEFQEALADIDEAAAYFDGVLESQESEAAEVLVEHHREMEEEIRYFQDILGQLETLLGNYITDMEGHIMPKNENQMMLVDRNDIWWNMKQIGSNLSSAKNVASGAELSYYSGIDTTPSPPHIHEGMSPSAQSAAWARYRQKLQESRNRKANYNKLESFCSGTAGSARSRLEEFYESLEDIYKKHVIEFENADDDYKREAARVYDACTSAGERFWDIGAKIGKLVNDINDGIDAAIYDFVSGIFGLAFTLAKIDVAIRVAVVTAPLGITPQWVKDTGKETIEGVQSIAQILRNPGRALASLGQQVTDTVEEKGITYALSYVTADIAIGILVDKGIGKIRGLDKADDVVNISTKVDDVVDVADDLGDTMKVVDKIDDVADVVDDVADITKAADKGDDVVRGLTSDKPSTQISPEMEKKILEGQRKSPFKNEIIGGHSPQINNSNDLFAVEELSVNADGTKNIKFIKDLQDGNISKIKKSTIFPDSWSDSKIIDSIKEVGDSPIVSIRGRDGATWHRKVIDGVEIDVIKLGDDVVSGYPTGKINAPKPSGF